MFKLDGRVDDEHRLNYGDDDTADATDVVHFCQRALRESSPDVVLSTVVRFLRL